MGYIRDNQNKASNPIQSKLLWGKGISLDYVTYYDKLLRIEYSVNAGISRDKIIIDPGIGFGKGPKHNAEILRQLDKLKSLNMPIMIGTSRKSFIDKVLELSGEDNTKENNSRLIGTLVTLIIAVTNGADIVRVHDVEEAVQAIKMYRSIKVLN